MKIAIITSTFYSDIADYMVKTVIDDLTAKQIKYQEFTVLGAYDIPVALSMVIKSQKFAGGICLGCVIRGATSHFDYVCNEASAGINSLARDNSFPVGFGIITANNQQQVEERKKKVSLQASAACIELIKIKKSLND